MACCTVATAANRAARRSSSATSSVVNELHRYGARNDPRLHAFIEEQADGGAAALAVVEGPVIDVHADESVCLAAIEPAREPHGVVERALSMIESVGDALAEMPRHFLLSLPRHVFANDVAAEWEWQTGFLEPPGAHVGDEVEAFVLVGELAFVDQQAGIHIAALHHLLDLIEGYDHRREVRLVEPERQVRAGHHSGDGYPLTSNFIACHRLFRHEHRSVTVAHRRAVGQQRVPI